MSQSTNNPAEPKEQDDELDGIVIVAEGGCVSMTLKDDRDNGGNAREAILAWADKRAAERELDSLEGIIEAAHKLVTQDRSSTFEGLSALYEYSILDRIYTLKGSDQ